MKARETIQATFEEALAKFTESPAVQFLLSEDMTVDAYASSLRQIYYQARENPQIQAYATARFRGQQRESIKRFYQHATSEIGHDQLALNDLKALGKDVSSLPLLSPAPTTIAVTSFAYYQAGHLNPVGYLGYLYFLEFLPTTAGGVFTNALRRVGVPDTAMSFLEEHTTVDVHHNRLMEGYVDALVRTEDDVQSVAYAMRVTGDLYARMLGQAFLAPAPEDHWGAACEEAA